MAAGIHVHVEGLPEEVQRVADIVDLALPGRLHWHALPSLATDKNMRIVGSTPLIVLPERDPRRTTYRAHSLSIDTDTVTLNKKLLSSALDGK